MRIRSKAKTKRSRQWGLEVEWTGKRARSWSPGTETSASCTAHGTAVALVGFICFCITGGFASPCFHGTNELDNF